MNTKNLSAWLSLGVATLALVLSQFSPIPSYFALPKLDFTVHKMLRISHALGEPILFPFLYINNSGNAQGSVSKIELVLTRLDSSFSKTFVAESYSQPEASVSFFNNPELSIPFGHIGISPGETWEGYIHFHEPFNLEQQNKNSEISRQMQEEFQEHFAGGQISGRFTFSEDLFRAIKKLTNDRLKSFGIGQYKIHLKIFDKSHTDPIVQHCHSFIIFDEPLKWFDKITETYRFGVYPSPVGNSVAFKLNPSSCD